MGGAPVLIVGRGPVGMTLALRLAGFGIETTVVDTVGRAIPISSKAVCMHAEAVEVLQRAGVGREIGRRGVAWACGRTYYRDRELFQITFPPPEPGAFAPIVNFPQSETERLLLARVDAEPLIDLRLGHTLTSLVAGSGKVIASIEGADGAFEVAADYLAGCDGARSSVRKLLGFGFSGHSHSDYYLIADIRASLPFASERRFYFDPPFNPGRTVLIHPQPDDMWHIDFQVGAPPDIDEERSSGRLEARIRAVIGNVDYELLWSTTYVFKQLIADRFSLGRAFLVGDAAHLYSPYGARGLNSGLADADNLAWKLAAVLTGRAPAALLDTYDHERREVAQRHFRITSQTARFMAPTTRRGRLRRDLTLAASTRVPWLRRYVNSGRFYTPLGYPGSPIVQSERDAPSGVPRAGELMPDLPIRCLHGHDSSAPERLRDLVGTGFLLAYFAPELDAARAAVSTCAEHPPAACTGLRIAVIAPRGAVDAGSPNGAWVLEDRFGRAQERFFPDCTPSGGRAFLVRPDCHIAARVDLDSVVELAQAGAWLERALRPRVRDAESTDPRPPLVRPRRATARVHRAPRRYRRSAS